MSLPTGAEHVVVSAASNFNPNEGTQFSGLEGTIVYRLPAGERGDLDGMADVGGAAASLLRTCPPWASWSPSRT